MDWVVPLVGWWYAHWSTLTWTEHAGNALAGALGATLYGFWASPTVKPPRWDPAKGELELNSLRWLIVGAIFAVIVDSGVVISIIAGSVALPVFTLVIKRLIPKLGDVVAVLLSARGGGSGAERGDS